MKTERTTRLKCAWQYLRDFKFIDLQHRAALRDFYLNCRRYIWGGMLAGLIIGILSARGPHAQAASAVLIVVAALLLAFA